jgi:hypothetical protein
MAVFNVPVFLDMTNTVFPTFQTWFILDFSSASCNGTLGLAEPWDLVNTKIFQSIDVASG